MLDIGLINYTRSAQANGKSVEEITRVLRENGQNEEQIRLIFDTVAGLTPAKNELDAPSGVSSSKDSDQTVFNPLKHAMLVLLFDCWL